MHVIYLTDHCDEDGCMYSCLTIDTIHYIYGLTFGPNKKFSNFACIYNLDIVNNYVDVVIAIFPLYIFGTYSYQEIMRIQFLEHSA